MEKQFHLQIDIADDGENVQCEVKMDGSVYPLTLVDVLAEVIPTALRENGLMVAELCSRLILGKRADRATKIELRLPDPGEK